MPSNRELIIQDLKSGLAGLDSQIEKHIQSEDDAILVARTRDMIRGRMQSGEVPFNPETEIKTELEGLLYQKELILSRIEQMKFEINQMEVEIRYTAAAENEASEQVPAQAGIFTRMGRWIKNLFSRKKPDESALPRRTKKEREARVTALVRQELTFDKEIEDRKAQAAKLAADLEKKDDSVARYRKDATAGVIERYPEVSADNHDEVALFLKPLMDFDYKQFVERFPLHKDKDEAARLSYVKALNNEVGTLMNLIKWSNESAMDILTAQEKDKITKASILLPDIAVCVKHMCLSEGNISYSEHIKKRIDEYSEHENCYQHRDELRSVYKKVSDLHITATVEKNDDDRALLEAAIIKTEEFSLIAHEGRPRLLGLESCAQLIRYGEEDLKYYYEMAKNAEVITDLLRDKTNPFNEGKTFTGIPESRKAQLLKRADEIIRICKGLELRFMMPGTTQMDVRKVFVVDDDKNGIISMISRQNSELDEFEAGTYAEKYSKEKKQARINKGRRLVEIDNKMEPVLDEKARLEGYDQKAEDLSVINSGVTYTKDYNEIHRHRVSDEETALKYAAKLRGFSLIDKTGRPRVVGNEPVDELLAYAHEDFSYYNELRSIGAGLDDWIRANDERAKALFGEEGLAGIRTNFVYAGRLFDALQLRLTKAGGATLKEVERKFSGRRDPQWPYRLMRLQLENFEGFVQGTSADGKMEALPRAERELLLFQHEKEMREYQAEIQKIESEQDIVGYSNIKNNEKSCKKVSYDLVRDAFVKNGWLNKNTVLDSKEHGRDEAASEKYIKEHTEADLDRFFRELENQECFNTLENGMFTYNDSHISIDDMMYLLNHRTPEYLERFLSPLINFDILEFAAKYPIEKMATEEERVALGRRMYSEMHHLNSLSQWHDKFGCLVMTDEQEKRYAKGTHLFNLFSFYMTSIGAPSGKSFKEYRDVAIGDEKAVYQFEEILRNEDELKALYNIHSDRHSLEKADRHKKLSEADGAEAKKALADRLAQRVMSLSLVSQNRPRLLGNEDYKCLVKYGIEDLKYYSEIFDASDLLDDLMRDKSLDLGFSEEKKSELSDMIQKVRNVYNAIEYRFREPSTSRTNVLEALRHRVDDPLWYERMQHAQLG